VSRQTRPILKRQRAQRTQAGAPPAPQRTVESWTAAGQPETAQRFKEAFTGACGRFEESLAQARSLQRALECEHQHLLHEAQSELKQLELTVQSVLRGTGDGG
jgi:hypothetical protein